LSESGRSVRGKVLVGDAVDEIARHAKEIGADLVVVGHKHLDSWAARWWRGSLSKSLIEHAPCSVLVVITR
jgi:nucleotide-binding universal stress UspA family protein